MMKFFLLAAAAVAAMSCVKENLPIENENPTPEVELVPMTFTASYAEADAETKVAYENGATVWQLGDKIMVISSTGTATEFEATEVTNGGKSATFEGLTENADEYYAVYPASAYKGTPEYVTDAAGGKLVVEVPQVQQAVAGTFHPSAILCIANTKGTDFMFKHSCAFLKFNIAAPEGVKSVRLKVNGSTNVAGIGYVGVNATDMNPKYASSDANMSAYDMITLNAPEGGFEAGKDYFIAMRANSCPDGITAYIEYEDKVMSRTSTNQVFTPVKDEEGNVIMSGSIGKIKNLGQLDKNLSDLTPYDSYSIGFDVMVAGKAINKDTSGDATLVTKAQGLNNNGVYFINSDVEGVSMNSGKSIVVIGNDPDKRSKVSRSGYSYIPATANEDYWILSNIDFNITSTSSYTLRLNGSNVCEMIIMNNCSSNVPSATQYIYGDANNKAKEIIIKDSEFLVEAASTNNFLNFAATQTVDVITFDNNVFYSADIKAPATSFTLIAAGNTTITDALVNKNTFYGAYPAIGGGNIINCKSNSMTVTNNMFGLNTGTDTNNVFVVGGKISEIMNFSNNAYFKNSAAKNLLTVTTSNAAPTGTNDGISSKVISTAGWNPAEGKFVINSSYGATR
ncbi:MAG: hypothetical protein J6U89_07705 [Bacteroidaceae bacterium]|nr:hypothetical protein [Bacteroidaceae bacterium]